MVSRYELLLLHRREDRGTELTPESIPGPADPSPEAGPEDTCQTRGSEDSLERWGDMQGKWLVQSSPPSPDILSVASSSNL